MRSHRGGPSPALIPPEFLGAWWRVAVKAPSQVASDYYRFQLLTGCRGVEICGHKLHEYPPARWWRRCRGRRIGLGPSAGSLDLVGSVGIGNAIPGPFSSA
jgi:hypothetical protein